MSEAINNAEYRAALGSINFNASNFQVFTFIIGITFLISLTFIVTSLVIIQSEDQAMPSSVLYGLGITTLIFLVLMAAMYFTYLKNIGRYIYARIRPVSTSMSACKRRSTGTSPR